MIFVNEKRASVSLSVIYLSERSNDEHEVVSGDLFVPEVVVAVVVGQIRFLGLELEDVRAFGLELPGQFHDDKSASFRSISAHSLASSWI